MNVRVLLFGALAHEVGMRETRVALPVGATVADAVAAVAGLYPAVGLARASLAYARNQEWARLDDVLCDQDELALIPPVSGG